MNKTSYLFSALILFPSCALLSALLLASCSSHEDKARMKPVATNQKNNVPPNGKVIACDMQTTRKEAPAKEKAAFEKPVKFLPPRINGKFTDAPPMQDESYNDGTMTSEEDHNDASGRYNKNGYDGLKRLEIIAPPISCDKPVDAIDEPAEFPGGAAAMREFLKTHIKMPQSAIESGVSGKCYLKFVVSKTGEISDVSVLKGVPGCHECDQEAKRVISLMPNWIPGKNNGVAVNSYTTIPIKFSQD